METTKKEAVLPEAETPTDKAEDCIRENSEKKEKKEKKKQKKQKKSSEQTAKKKKRRRRWGDRSDGRRLRTPVRC